MTSREDADRIIRDCQVEERQATPEEMQKLVEYLASLLAPRALGSLDDQPDPEV